MVVLCTTFAKNIHYVNKRDSVNPNSINTETSDECKYINSLLERDESYNCCDYIKYDSAYDTTDNIIIK